MWNITLPYFLTKFGDIGSSGMLACPAYNALITSLSNYVVSFTKGEIGSGGIDLRTSDINDSVSFSNCAIQRPQVLGANTGWMLVVTS